MATQCWVSTPFFVDVASVAHGAGQSRALSCQTKEMISREKSGRLSLVRLSGVGRLLLSEPCRSRQTDTRAYTPKREEKDFYSLNIFELGWTACVQRRPRIAVR
ncbi:hypothetical protein [Pandoravirus japonicus]|uniref:Uncharacterized protein n=1 Tax=Pandoravirus japonicus TaxID=2823154 RepID=A0A811BPJ1_9VIRU|nr:hypothetical protein [Pandoravirus japonicus]